MRERIEKLFNLENILVFTILVAAFLIRVFNITKNLAFHYDQGRDALVIWDLIHLHKFFLIGPTTGLAGVFRGPFYYYLIAPFYWLGRGNPIWPEVFLILTSVLALGLMYYLARSIGGIKAGIISLILGTFSFEVVYASRWLSNPTPMLLLSMLLVWMMFLVYEGRKWAWIVLAFILGSSFFHFGSSGELFYFPAVLIFAILMIKRQGFGKSKSTLDWKIILLSIGTFLITFAPLFIFNLKHGGILSNNVGGLLSSSSTSFGIPTLTFISDRFHLIIVYFSALLFHNPSSRDWLVTNILWVVALATSLLCIKNDKFKIICLFLLSPTLGLLFFQGNYGSLYSYYLTGYFLIFILFISIALGKLSDHIIGKILIVLFILYFINQNTTQIKPYINVKGMENGVIVLNTQKTVIDWVYKNAGNRDFNVDVYVPPVISYSYDYLFKWLGTAKYHKLSLESQVPLLYTVYEADPDHPERLKAWLDRQKGIGSIIKEQSFGGITVQERKRLSNIK